MSNQFLENPIKVTGVEGNIGSQHERVCQEKRDNIQLY